MGRQYEQALIAANNVTLRVNYNGRENFTVSWANVERRSSFDDFMTIRLSCLLFTIHIVRIDVLFYMYCVGVSRKLYRVIFLLLTLGCVFKIIIHFYLQHQ